MVQKRASQGSRRPSVTSVSSSTPITPSFTTSVITTTDKHYPHQQQHRDARHTRATSWTSGHDQGGEPSFADYHSSASHSRRRRESNLSLADLTEGSSPSSSLSFDHPNLAMKTTSSEWNPGHARSRSQSMAQMNASQAHSISDPAPRPGPVTWMSLPRKKQLALLGLCRVFDFLQIASLQAYMFYQLKSFDETLSDSDVSTQAGILQGAFTAAQFATAIPWGRVADAEWGGRKFVLLVGLVGTAVSCLGVAFSTSFAQAVFWRSFGGAINGTVGIIRTMIAENVKEKKYHSRAFLILPIGFNIAALFGPGKVLCFHCSCLRFDTDHYSHGRYACRSRQELPPAVRPQFFLWRCFRCPVAHEIPLCVAHAGQRRFPVTLRYVCRSGP